MKKIKYILPLFIFLYLLSCTDDNDLVNVDNLEAPSNISALMKITQDNTGKVTILPTGQGVSQFQINFGDGSPSSDLFNPGETVDHIYNEGVYQVALTGISLNGKQTTVMQELTVSFLPPTDLVVNITTGTNLSVNVSATAELETYFQVYYGEDPNQVPVDFMEGETVTYNYSSVGTYDVTVVALSGGTATTQVTQSVVITNLTEAPVPTIPSANVISMFSNTYTNVPVDTWLTGWSQGNLEETNINGNDVKKYTNVGFVGIETVSNMIDASGMTHFHTDVWSGDFTDFKIKLVDFGADAAFGGGDDVEHELSFPNLPQEQWVSLDIPLSDFTNLTTTQHIAQLIYVGIPFGSSNFYIDNVFFYDDSAVLSMAAPTPTLPAGNVISMFSDAYTNVPVDTWLTGWSSGILEDVLIAGNPTKKYSNLNFVGIESVTSTINANAMTHFHVDFWSADCTEFKIKLVDFGANGVYDGGGDDVEHELTYTNPTQGQWISYDIPLSDFTGLITREHIAQLIFVGAPSGNNTIYIDNVYFHN